MKMKAISLPELILMAGTRVALGAGIGLLISQRLDDGQRKAAGLALLGVGILTTIPLLIGLLNDNVEEDERRLKTMELPDLAVH